MCLLFADTLHRFCKKEHDWGWKKFMELNKVLEGFTVSNTLVIKAQVQVIRCAKPSNSSYIILNYGIDITRYIIWTLPPSCHTSIRANWCRSFKPGLIGPMSSGS